MTVYVWTIGEETPLEFDCDDANEFIEECRRDEGIWIREDEVERFIPWHAVVTVTFESESG